MIFWTVLFLLFTITSLITGGTSKKISNLSKELGEFMLLTDKEEKEAKTGKAFVVSIKLNLILLFGIAYIIAFIIYLSVGMSIPETKLISLIMLIIYLIATATNMIKNKKKDYDLKSEEGRAKYFAATEYKRTFKDICLQLLYVVYFVAMLVLLVM